MVCRLRGGFEMCNCSEHQASAGAAKVPVTSAGPTMKPLVPLSRQIPIGDADAEDQPSLTGSATDTGIQAMPARLSRRLLPDQLQADRQPRDLRRHAARRSLGPRRRADHLIVERRPLLAPAGDRSDHAGAAGVAGVAQRCRRRRRRADRVGAHERRRRAERRRWAACPASDPEADDSDLPRVPAIIRISR